MDDRAMLTFGAFRLDRSDERLWHGDEVVRLTTKAFAVLRYLVEHAGQLVTRDELAEAVWATPQASDAALASCLRDIRRALGDTAQVPQWLETVRGRGYRLLVPAPPALPPPALGAAVLHPPSASLQPAFLLGRHAELAHLHQCYASAVRGARQVVCITGEAGIGKTTLVDNFVASLAATDTVWLGRGQCIEQYGAGAAYLPLLETLSALGRAPAGTRLVDLLQQYAPSWLLHLPALVPAATFETLQRRVHGTTQEHMLRELAKAVEVLSVERPLVLLLEDLHWSDAATLAWLAYVARRRAPARLLVLSTYRSVEAVAHDHPLRAVMQELQVHGLCTELPMQYFSEAEIAAYLAQRFAVPLVADGLAHVLHQRTTGNLLFLVTLVDDLWRQGVLWLDGSQLALRGGLEAVTASIPESLRRMIELQLDQLPAMQQRLLEAASVVGKEFPVAAVAACVTRAVDDVEAQCTAMVQHGQFLRLRGIDTWPDGTVATRYGFIHDLYRETVYVRIPAGRRVRWHQQIGVRLETGYGAQAQDIAAELAEHFVQGRDIARAIPYIQKAGEQARQRRALQAALTSLTHGLELLHTLPDTPVRRQHELALQMALGAAFADFQGPMSSDAAQAYARAYALSQQVGETHNSLPYSWDWHCFT